MNKFILAALVAVQTASAVVYEAVDDPRCHDEPSRPVLEPTPGPTPYPDPPTNDRIVEMDPPATTAPPPEVPCTGEVTGFQVYDLSDSSNVLDLEDGQVLELADLPASFTIKAVTSTDDLTAVEMYLDGTLITTDTTAPFLFGDDNFLALNTEGVYTLKAVGPTDTPGLTCAVQITVTYGNPHNCEGIIQQFALFDTETQAIVPGYDLLENNEVLKKVDLPHPEKLTIIAIDNGRGNGEIKFGVDNDFSYSSTTSTPAAISGTDADGNVLPWQLLNEKEFITIRAMSSDVFGNAETKVCEIQLQIEHNWECPYIVKGFNLIKAGTHEVIPGYANILGYKAVNLETIDAPNGLTIEAISTKGKSVQFFLNGDYVKAENNAPYAINGDNSGGQHEYEPLRETGRYVFEAKHSSESNDLRCQLVLTIQRDMPKTIDNDEYCAPEAVVPEQVGNLMFYKTPVVVTTRVTNETVSFKTVQTIDDRTMDWVTTVFVAGNGDEVCNKVDNMAQNDESEYTYSAKCFDGFAYADVYAASSTFAAGEATADISLLPPGCKTPDATKVVKYTFVFSCDCDNIPDVPDEVVGGPTKSQQTCVGTTGWTWGEPHMNPFYEGSPNRKNEWDCQGEGEFVLAKATLDNFPYDFEMRARFTEFGQDFPWSFNSAMVAKQDVSVQLSMGVIGEEAAKPNYFADVPVYFYVDGQPRYLHESTGDNRVSVYVEGYYVYITFLETGIQIIVRVRPLSVDNHSGVTGKKVIPGSFSTYLCLPSENDAISNVIGLLGTPSASMTDNFMKSDGTPISKPANATLLTQYCITEWCIADEADTMFTFEPGYSFSDYNKCPTPARRNLLEEADLNNPRKLLADYTIDDVDPECGPICEQVDFAQSCIEECAYGGADAAIEAVKILMESDAFRANALAGPQPDDDRCCSVDYKTCMEGCEVKTASLCTTCDPEAVFLPKGYYETTQGKYKDCVKKGDAVGSGQKCCPNLDGSSGTCVKKEARRNLEEFKFARPGLANPDKRNIVPLHSEL